MEWSSVSLTEEFAYQVVGQKRHSDRPLLGHSRQLPASFVWKPGSNSSHLAWLFGHVDRRFAIDYPSRTKWTLPDPKSTLH